MQYFNKTEQIAFQQRQVPLKQAKYFQVKSGNTVLFENNSIALCWKYIKENSLNGLKPKGVY